jgi:hypothetical protein
MIFEQHYLECLSQASYFIGDGSTGRAVVVDPRRDIAPYLASAAEHGMTIELVLETHFHADFLSGHLELAAATGASIAYGSVAEPEFESRKLAHLERISLGLVELEIRHTPGHTPESISIVVFESGEDAVPSSTPSINSCSPFLTRHGSTPAMGQAAHAAKTCRATRRVRLAHSAKTTMRCSQCRGQTSSTL